MNSKDLPASPWYLYIVSCSDGSLYTGITTDVERRVLEHNDGPNGARYTRAKRPVTLCFTMPFPSRSEASKAEHKVKKLSRSQKERLISNGDKTLVS